MDIRIIESKDALALVCCDTLRYCHDVLVESSTHEVEIAKDECFLWVESHSNDVLRILSGIFLDIRDLKLLFEQELLIVCQHDYQWHIENLL